MLQTSFGLLWILWHSRALAAIVLSEELIEPEVSYGDDQNWASSPQIPSQIAPPTTMDDNIEMNSGASPLVVPGGFLAELSQIVEPAPTKRFFSILSPAERLRAMYKQRPKPVRRLMPVSIFERMLMKPGRGNVYSS